MAQSDSNTLDARLATLLPRSMVEEVARERGVVQRQRKVDVYALVWTLVLGFQTGSARTIEALRGAYQRVSSQNLARSAFYDRLTAELAATLRQLAVRAMDSLGRKVPTPQGYLTGFQDLLAIDSTVLKLHDWLSKAYAATRTNSTKASAKLHMVMSVLDGSPRRVKLTPERTNDRTPWRKVGRWVEGRLLLFDLGYFSYSLFDRIDHNDGYFLSRLKANANPLIVDVHRRWRGRSIVVAGRRLRDVIGSLQREILDVEARVEFDRRSYRGKRSRARRTFRVIAIRNHDSGEYHVYVTNVPPEKLAAEDITRTYSLRWQVELLFKAMKTHGHLDQLPSRKKCVVECLVWASVLSLLASQALYRLIRSLLDPDRALPLLRWASKFAEIAGDLLALTITPNCEEERKKRAFLLYNAPDPNRNREDRALDPILGIMQQGPDTLALTVCGS